MDLSELAIIRTVVYASLFDYPLTLEELRYSLVESRQGASEILAIYDGSEAVRRIVEYRDGFFFPAGRAGLVAERRRREARSRAFLDRHRLLLRLVCALPFTRLVALSGSIAHLNLEPDGDLDLFIVTRGPHVWSVMLALLVLTRLFGRRRTVCANFILADSHLALDQADLFTANQVIHLKPIVGGETLAAFAAANPFVRRFYPNADVAGQRLMLVPPPAAMARGKALAETVLAPVAPVVETLCRRIYTRHLRGRAPTWRSPDQVRLQSDLLKLHTRSHRERVLGRFHAALAEIAASETRRASATEAQSYVATDIPDIADIPVPL